MLGWLNKTKLHFIGIGGIGMSGIAEVLLDLGYQVSGSDLNLSPVIENLIKKGAEIFQGHAEDNVIGSTIIIYSSAIDSKNPEVMKAQELGIPLIRRAEMLAELMRLKFGIAIAGSHGKTTTTSLVATIFQEAQLDATHIIGGIVRNLGGNAKKGDGKFLIAEADESDGSFLLLKPIMAAVTNIDNDHLDHYGSKEKIVEAFVEFVNNLPFYGRVSLNANDVTSQSIKTHIRRPVVWYGIDIDIIETEYVANNVELSAAGTKFDLYYQGQKINRFETHLLGMHNISNTLAAISTAHGAGLSWEIIQKGLLSFQGVGRRLEKLFDKDNFLIIDDYGHHPTELKVTISTLRKVDERPIYVIFEPHRYSRTQNFWEEFQTSFTGADEVYITPIYAASEKPIEGITSEKLVEEMSKRGIRAHYLDSLERMNDLVSMKRNEKAVFVTLGAGAISKKIRECVAKL